MFQAPDYTRTMSMRLSEVLADIGVDKRIILKTRRAWLLRESMYRITTKQQYRYSSVYNLGSQCEGSTTPDLASDFDQLICAEINLIQDWASWEPGLINYLMIQDETVSPGYCLLQCLRKDAPLPYNYVDNEYFCKDRTGRILAKNTIISAALTKVFGVGVRHGPAIAQEGQPGYKDTDFVIAYPCKSWPLPARQWLNKQGLGRWPSDDLKRCCSNTGCFVVGVASKDSENEEFEWRISTSLAERHLVFNLNITQMRCYILMKMILKTFIKPHFENTISSYMCKTVLFHCIANAHSNIWRENNLLVCLSLCIFVLYNTIWSENCPHFIITGNNLMRGHIPHELKPYILEIMHYIINSEGRALLGIECDGLGARILFKLYNISPYTTSDFISGQLLKTTALFIDDRIQDKLKLIRNSNYEEAIQILKKNIFELVSISNQCQGLDKKACCILVPRFCTTLGFVLASLNICRHNNICDEALTWISLGLNTDIASSKLKLASVFYCIGDTQKTELVLKNIEGRFDLNIVEPVCRCHKFISHSLRRGFNAISDNHNEEVIQYTTASCVKFLSCELNCVPHELRYEMFRSTQDDLVFRSRDDDWMDLAVVDSLPYLYFLQYKVYSNLGRNENKQRALSFLVRTIIQEPNLGHKETALNLLGQCMEQEDRTLDAFHCYSLSLHQRGRNNAAKVHICRLFSTMVNDN